VSWAAVVVALHLVSGADRAFSTCKHGAAEFERVQALLARFNGAEPGAWDERDALPSA
jgi:hypothetical protein